MLGVMGAEFAFTWLLEHLYDTGATRGLYAWAGNDPTIASALLIGAKLLGTATVVAWTLRRNRERWHAAGRFTFSPAILGLAFLPIIAGLIILLSEIDNVFRALLPEFVFDRLDFAPDLEQLVSASWSGPVLAVIIAPLTEEWVFRGLILRGLLGRWRPAAAIAVSALLFALIHFNPAHTSSTGFRLRLPASTRWRRSPVPSSTPGGSTPPPWPCSVPACGGFITTPLRLSPGDFPRNCRPSRPRPLCSNQPCRLAKPGQLAIVTPASSPTLIFPWLPNSPNS